jgi:CheY-like chemotaxis protein
MMPVSTTTRHEPSRAPGTADRSVVHSKQSGSAGRLWRRNRPGHGKDAIEKAIQLYPDLILLDLAMPVVNGAEAAAILKDQAPMIPIILFTLHQEKSLASHLKVAKVIGKPDGTTKLLNSIREVLGIPSPPVIGPLRIAAPAGSNGTRYIQTTTSMEDKIPE